MLKRLSHFLLASMLVFSIFTLVPARIAYAADPPEDTKTQMSCEGGSGLSTALAWVLCPIAHLITDATDFIQRNIIVPFLTVSPLNTDADNAVYILWQSVRNIANIVFIIAFFFVIFSQATSIGLSNYGIKRLLPRLAFVAIGTNLSYFIVAFAIDAFNVIGAGISNLVIAAIPANPSGVDTGGGGQAIFFTAAGLGILFTPAAGPVLQWLFSLLGIAFLILLVAVIVLVLRQMIILILIIVSPLAFVAYLLPNTENYFDKWRKMLLQLLMMQPLMILLFATGKIVAALINSGNFVLASGDASGGVADAIKVVMAFFASTIPIIALPATLLAANSLIARITSAVRGRTESARAASANKIGNTVKPRLQGVQQRLAGNQMGLDENGNSIGGFRGRAAGLVGGVVRHRAGYGTRRDFKQQQRERELQRAREEYLADTAAGSERFRRSAAGGVGGDAGAQRVQAEAFATQEKAEKQELDNAMAVLRNELQRRNIDPKSFAGGDLATYLRDGTDAKGRGYAQIFNNNRSLLTAALNSAAEQGEVGTMEAARTAGALAGTNLTMDQTMVDRIIRQNDGKMKEKGGYHLATNFNLGAGRMVETNAKGEIRRNAQGQAIPITNPQAMAQEIEKQRLLMIASTGAGSISKMKAGVLGSTAALIASGEAQIKTIPAGATPEQAARITQENQVAAEFNARHTAAMNVINANPEMRQAIRARMQEIASNPNTLKDTEAPGAIRKMYLKFAFDDPTPKSAQELGTLQAAFKELTPKEKQEVRAAAPNIPPAWT